MSDAWVIDQLAVFLGFDPETLQTQVIPYLMSIESPIELQQHLQDMLGTTADTIAFTEKFLQMRFPPARAAKASPRPSASPKTSASNSNRGSPTPAQAHRPPVDPNALFPSLPPQQQSTSSSSSSDNATNWPTNFNVQIKKDTKKKKSSSATQSSSTLVSDRLEKKKKKQNANPMTLESALKELDIKVDHGKKRRTCNCQATKHELLTIAPNCLNCGKIICVAEGVGPCTFCGTPVLSKEQQLSLIAEAKKKRAEEKQKQNQQTSTRKSKATPQVSVGYASKVSGNIVYAQYDESIEIENRLRAEQHKEKLLDYQQSSAQRTKVIDQASDFAMPTDEMSPWLSAQERALLLKKQQANMKRLEQPRASQRRVLTIDIGTKQARVETAVDVSSDESDDDDNHADAHQQQQAAANSADKSHSAGTYARNPLLKGMHPVFMRTAGNGKGKQAANGSSRTSSAAPTPPPARANRLQDTMGDS
ncbi:putative zinc finger motif, C2HC5-type-domain-containing protein [Gongronella butleri]|nr:putative zinc finger motif, C2HC5-type-domain-containing protein [Gongronella butleri]